MATPYSIVFINKSGRTGDVCLYQSTPKQFIRPEPESGHLTLAWFTKKTNTGTKARFAWNTDFCFIWDDLINTEPGRVVDASQTVEAGLYENNAITLSKKKGAYEFTDQSSIDRFGLSVMVDNSVPKNEVVVGYGMAGSGLFAVPVAYNMMYQFIPQGRTEYHIAFGDFETGQILDVPAMECTAAVDFPPNVYSMQATLNEDNTWTIIPNRTLLSEED